MLGAAYKRDIDDVRESPCLDSNSTISTFHPPILLRLGRKDCVVVAGDQSGFYNPSIVEKAKLKVVRL